MAPSVAPADNRDGDTDTDLAALASAAAASAAGAAAFARALSRRFPPRQLPEYSGPPGQDVPKGPPKLKDFDEKPPPPWWVPDGLGDIL